MAKETKAQARMRLEMEAMEALARTKETFMPRVFTVVSRAQAEYFDVDVLPLMQFEVHNARTDDLYTLDVVFSPEALEVLEELEYDLDRLEQVRKEKEAKATLKAAALAKLTADERVLLGL